MTFDIKVQVSSHKTEAPLPLTVAMITDQNENNNLHL